MVHCRSLQRNTHLQHSEVNSNELYTQREGDMCEMLLNHRARRDPRGHLGHLLHFPDEEREVREVELGHLNQGVIAL